MRRFRIKRFVIKRERCVRRVRARADVSRVSSHQSVDAPYTSVCSSFRGGTPFKILASPLLRHRRRSRRVRSVHGRSRSGAAPRDAIPLRYHRSIRCRLTPDHASVFDGMPTRRSASRRPRSRCGFARRGGCPIPGWFDGGSRGSTTTTGIRHLHASETASIMEGTKQCVISLGAMSIVSLSPATPTSLHNLCHAATNAMFLSDRRYAYQVAVLTDRHARHHQTLLKRTGPRAARWRHRCYHDRSPLCGRRYLDRQDGFGRLIQ